MKRNPSRPGPIGTSCLTCKHRRKRCDQTRPFCVRCTTGGFDCLGYGHLERQFLSPNTQEFDRHVNEAEGARGSPPLDLSTGRLNTGLSPHGFSMIPPATVIDGYSDISSLSYFNESGPKVHSQEIATSPDAFVTPVQSPHSSCAGSSPRNCPSENSGAGALVSQYQTHGNILRNGLITTASARRPPTAPFWLPAHPRILSLTPDDTGQMTDFILLQYERITKLGYFRPLSRQVAHIRKTLIHRIRTSPTMRLLMFLGCKVFESHLDGTAEEKFPLYASWLNRLDRQLLSTPAWTLSPAEYQTHLAGTLGVIALKFRLSNSTNVYQLLKDSAPAFLQIALMETTWQWTPLNPTSVSLAHLLASPRYELAHFALIDSLCSMAYVLPHVVDYDTSVPPFGEDVHPIEWVHGCPTEFQLILVDINNYSHQRREGHKLDWQLTEKRLKSWNSAVKISEEGESLKTVARLAVQESWRHTLLIYLYMAVYGVASDDARVQASVRQIFQLTSTANPAKTSVINIHLLVQFLFAGACARSEKQRAVARRRLGEVSQEGLWVIRGSDFVSLLDHLWHGAAAGGRPIRWSDYAFSRQVALPIPI
ncbi:hypothetical protein FRC08_009235 [Ceratobasidium sp. 394]|nr:hypothetical protein FRC08_009235 [Ceratobasidium sp. 394]KAG9098603.1 hypothetical protein FS749_003429 [Ceratobasidium sp. UAMH 11750]